MCIIIYRPAGAATRVSRQTLRHCAMENSDGFGLMWVYQGKLNTARYLWEDLDVFIKRTLALQDGDIPFCAHFRFTTHGKNTLDNVHPFWIHKKESAIMHNGILNIRCEKDWSDTRTFVNAVLRRLPPTWDATPHLRWVVDEATVGSKFAIMRRDGSVTLVHEKAGVWDGGIWYSNAGYRESKWGGWEDYVWTEEEKAAMKKGGFPFKTPASNFFQHTGVQSEADKQALAIAEGRALAARLAWEEAQGTHLTGVSTVKLEMGTSSTTPNPNPAVVDFSVGDTSKLYMFEGMVVCEDCKRMESSATNLPALSGVEVGDSCDLCHMPGTPTLVAVR